jgi:O-antigen ligase
MVAHGTILGLTLWLLYMANSSTSTACFVLGSAVILIGARMARRRPAAIHAIVGATAFVGLFSYVFDDAWTALVHTLGRETNLTGRTDIWNDVLNLHVNPVIGTGFESFWLGARADYFWSKYVFHPNEAHNGYLEVFLNGGWIGVVLLVPVIVFGYRSVIAAFRRNLPWATLLLSFLVISLVYNITEAAFKVIHPVFIAFLFAAIAVPEVPVPEGPTPRSVDHLVDFAARKPQVDHVRRLKPFDPSAAFRASGGGRRDASPGCARSQG